VNGPRGIPSGPFELCAPAAVREGGVEGRMQDDDRRLVTAILSGEPDRFAELFERHTPAVRRIVGRAVRVGSPGRSFDVVVEWDQGFHTRGWNL